MAWERLSHVALSSAGDTISSGTITAKKNLKVILHLTSTGGNVNPSLRFNSDSGSNYVIRDSDSGGTDDTQTGQTGIRLSQGGHGGSFGVFYVNFEITNISDKEKLSIVHSLRMTQTGAANTPHRYEMASKWTNTSAQITSIQVINGGTGDFAIGSYITVLGATSDVTSDEKTTLSDIPANTRYEETDTRKIYRWKQAPLEPVFHYKFSESSGDVINHGSIANADLTVGSLTRDQSTPSGIGNGMKTPNEDSGYAENTSRVNDYKFMHDGTAKWSITFWLKCYGVPDTSTTEHMLFGNVWTDDAGVGFGIRLAKNSDNSSSKARIQTMVARNAGGMPVNDQTADDMMPDTSNWHFYCITYDPTLSSNNLTISRDAETSGTGFSQDDTTNENWSTSNPTRKTTYMARPTTGGNAYDNGVEGTMAQVMIFKDVILTQANKESLYASGNGTTTIPDSKEWVERGTA